MLVVVGKFGDTYINPNFSNGTDKSVQQGFFKLNPDSSININSAGTLWKATNKNSSPTPPIPQDSVSFFNFVDVIQLLWEGISLLFTLAFGIYWVFYTIGLPFEVAFMIAAPLSIAYTLALLAFIRTGEL
jgi:hypothetical protein